MTLQDLIDKTFGVRTSVNVNPLVAQVGTTPTRIASNNPNRVALVVVNLSANTLYVLPDENVTTTRGILVGANGGNFQAVWNEDFQITGWAWHAVASAGASDILVLEIVIVE